MVRVEKASVHICGACTVIVGVLVMMICFLSLYTLQEVKQSEFAVEYNTYTIEFGPVLSQGKYDVAVGSELITFPRTLIDLELKGLSCLSKDQVIVSLDIQIQIQYAASALVPIILMQFGNEHNFRKFLAGMAKSSVFDSCADFNADSYFTNRAMIDISMTANVAEVINLETLGTSVVFFQLVNIEFPREYKDVLTSKQTTAQHEITLANDRLNQLTIANTNLFVANNTANIRIIKAQQEAATILNQATTNRLAVEAFWASRTESFMAVMTNLDYSNTSQLLDFVNSEIIRTNNKLVAGVK